MKIKVRVGHFKGHRHITFFMGEEGRTFVNNGMLAFTDEEYLEFCEKVLMNARIEVEKNEED